MSASVTLERAPAPTSPVAAFAFGAGLGFFGTAAWSLMRMGAPTGLTIELWNIASSDATGTNAYLLKFFGEFATFVSAIVFSAVGLGPDSLRVVTVLAAAALLGFVAQSCARRSMPAWQVILIVAAVAFHPIFLAAAITGSTMLMRALAFFALVTWLYRIEFVGDIQAKMTFGIVLAVMVLLDPNAGYVLVPILLLLPWIYRNIRSGHELVAAYFLILTPALLSAGAILAACTLATGFAPWRLIGLWFEPLHGYGGAPIEFAWYNAMGGQLGEAMLHLGELALAAVPVSLLVLIHAVLERRARVMPRTAALSLLLPLFAGAVATYFYHLHSPWPALLNLLAAALAWLCKAHLSDRARLGAIALLFVGTAVAWTYPPLWQEPGLVAWRASMIALLR